MKSIIKAFSIGVLATTVAACGSDGTSSNAGTDNDASSCVTRTLRTIYSNDCDFDVNVIVFERGAEFFLIRANRAVTKSETGNSFGACRAPSIPVLNADASNFSCT